MQMNAEKISSGFYVYDASVKYIIIVIIYFVVHAEEVAYIIVLIVL